MIFFERLSDFLVERLCDFFLVERLRDFLLLRGCMIFLFGEVA